MSFKSFLRSRAGFTGAEKALLVCFGLGTASTVGYLVSQGSNKAANDAVTALTTQSGGSQMGHSRKPMQAAGTVASAGAAVQKASLLQFSGDFAAAPPGAEPLRPAAPAPPAPVAPAAAGPTITPAELLKIVPQMGQAKADEYAGPISQAMAEYGITTKAREAAFLGQIAEETDGFNTLTEYASGKEYEGRCKDLGNCSPGDGVKYKGRGAIQLTGKANYAAASKAFGVDLVDNPALAATPQYAFKIAGWYWQTHGLNALADQGAFSTITRRINGGLNGESTRVLYWNRAKAALGS